jgi:hypothetical protein
MPMQNLYEADFYLWTQQQAAALRAGAGEGSNAPVDWENLAEEIESLGRSQRSRIDSFTRQIMVHLLLLACSPALAPARKWRDEIREFRYRLREVLAVSPSLRRIAREESSEAFGQAMRQVRARLKDYGEFEQARAALESWSARQISFDEVLEDELYPSSSTAEMQREST